MPDGDDLEAWVASGLASLTGRADGPALPPPPGLVPRLRALGEALAPWVRVDPLALVAERVETHGLRRGGATSCGGSSWLLPSADDWVAVSLPRPDDVDLLPAWLGISSVAELGDAVAGLPATAVVATGVELGLAVARLGESDGRAPVVATEGAPGAGRAVEDAVVVDLSALWAGPLCGRLLADAGADVVKVESPARPDGARFGPPAFFERMNGRKRPVTVDFATRALHDLLVRADVVIDASRPRALRALGIDVEALVAERAVVWVSITGHGRAQDRIAFGDDAAVAGGAVVWDDDGPCFCADALADPVSGLTAAAAVFDALDAGGGWLLDVSMAACAASLR